MPTETVFIESLHDKARIETRVTYNPDVQNQPAIVIAHPYGPLGTTISLVDTRLLKCSQCHLQGGNFVNNVVVTLHKYFAEKGYVAASLNFRQVLSASHFHA